MEDGEGLVEELLGLLNLGGSSGDHGISERVSLGLFEIGLGLLESFLGVSVHQLGSETGDVWVGRSHRHVSDGVLLLLGTSLDGTSGLCKGLGFSSHGCSHNDGEDE